MRKSFGKIIPQAVRGRIRRRKDAVLYGLLGLYIVTPWLRWPRGGDVPDQAILMDIVGRRIFVGPIELWPNELYYLMALLMIGAFSLFAVTSMYGRLWCGFTCPQTVWSDLFLKVEILLEGDRNQRLKNQKAGLTPELLLRKAAKHAIWLSIAVLTSATWLSYFNNAPDLWPQLLTATASGKIYGFLGVFTFTTYMLGGFAREKVCLHMCPWPRFQSAMLEPHSLIVSYQSWRGEPRGHGKAAERAERKLGDCVDCGQCVAVCPVGIDIRDGLQFDCIGCGLCVDACNSIMAKTGGTPDLVLYDSLSHQEARNRHETPPEIPKFRPRPIIYGSMAGLVAVLAMIMFLNRPMLELRAEQVRAPLMVTMKDGTIRNAYVIAVQNKFASPQTISVTSTLPGGSVSATGLTEDKADHLVFALPPRALVREKIYVHHEGDLHGQQRFMFEVKADNARTRHVALFHGRS